MENEILFVFKIVWKKTTNSRMFMFWFRICDAKFWSKQLTKYKYF